MVKQMAQSYFTFTHLVIIAGLALSIAGGIKSIPTNKPDEISNGVILRKAASILLLFAYLVNLALSALGVVRLREAYDGDRKIIYAAAISMPFLLLRTLYAVVVAFDTHSTTFNAFRPNIYAQAFMQTVMEFIVWGIYLAAGLTSPKMKPASHIDGEGQHHKSTVHDEGLEEAELGTIPASRAA
jgi:low temperature requirement protein LtrA